MPSGYLKIELSGAPGFVELDGDEWRAHKPFMSQFGRRGIGKITPIQKQDVFSYEVRANQMSVDRNVIRATVRKMEYANRFDYALCDQARAPFFFFNLPPVGKKAEGELRDRGVASAGVTNVGYPFNAQKTWLGLGLKGGFTGAIWGKELLVGAVVNLSTGEISPMVFSATRWGVGLGASAGLTLICVTGSRTSGALLDTPSGGPATGGWDFNLAVGPNWAKCFSALNKCAWAAKSPVMTKALRAMGDPGAVVDYISKAILSEERANVANWAKNLAGVTAYNADDRNVITFDLPISDGLEISFVTANGSIVACGPDAVMSSSQLAKARSDLLEAEVRRDRLRPGASARER